MPGAEVATGAAPPPRWAPRALGTGRRADPRPIRGTVHVASRRRGPLDARRARRDGDAALFAARSAGSRDTYSPSASPFSSVASDDGACVFERDDVARLPNGARMRFVSKPDVQFLYDEIFADECYAKHGLEIRPGATVIDVGGNIGMFALYAAEKAGAEGRVFALEPIPRTFAALRENVIRNVGFSSTRRSLDARSLDGEKEGKKEAARPSGTSRVACLDAKDAALALRRNDEFRNSVTRDSHTRETVVAYNVGVSDGEEKAATFTFYPRAAGWSSLAPDDAETRENVRRFVERRLSLPEESAENLDDAHGASAATAALHPLATLGAKLLAFADGGGGASRKQEEAFSKKRFRRRISESLVRFARRLARLAFSLAVSAVTAYLLGGKTTSACPLVTVSDVIRANGLGDRGAATDENDERQKKKPYAVDFLKIDVERNELATLRGIDRTHRTQIAQIAMEVHDDERNGLRTVIDLLTAPASGDGFGFPKTRVVAEQPDELKGGSLWNVYARR